MVATNLILVWLTITAGVLPGGTDQAVTTGQFDT